MKISVAWLNEYLDRPATADEIADHLTAVGFPVEERWDAEGGDVGLDVEVTSNRGDCLSHVGLARELAAATGRSLKLPDCGLPDAVGPDVTTVTSVENADTKLCPVYTARVIQGVKVGPSPEWLRQRLEAVNLRSINNVVDVTNYVMHELGQPSHAFDLAKLNEQRIVVRTAAPDEPFTALDQSSHKLKAPMLVIADAAKPQCMAGVMGGLDSEVSETTTDVLLEVAAFDALNTRRTSRALKLASDSSYRYERGTDLAGIDRASRRIAKLIVELAGGTVCDGLIRVGVEDPTPGTVALRPSRCSAVLGVDIPAEAQASHLQRLGITTRVEGDSLQAQVPTFRLDLLREIDLVEEVGRLHGLDALPVNQKISIVARPPQPQVQARQRLTETLVAHGYHEAITFSFLAPEPAHAFCPKGAELVRVDDDRRKAEPMLRPALVPSLLQCRKGNQDAGNHGVKLFETASVWHRKNGRIVETVKLGLIADAEDAGAALRGIRGMLDELVDSLGATGITVEPGDGLSMSSAAVIRLGAAAVGHYGVIDDATLKLFGLQSPVVAAELALPPLLELYPPTRTTRELPKYPGIERDLSVLVDEPVPWARLESAVREADPALLEDLAFVGVYRGKQAGAGRKSVTFRMRFRDPQRTLRHDEVDPQVATVVDRLKVDVGAEVRG